MNPAVLYGMKKIMSEMETTSAVAGALERGSTGNEFFQRVEDFKSEMKTAYNNLSPEQKKAADKKIEEVKDFIRDSVQREAKEHVKESMCNVDSQLNLYLAASTLTMRAEVVYTEPDL